MPTLTPGSVVRYRLMVLFTSSSGRRKSTKKGKATDGEITAIIQNPAVFYTILSKSACYFFLIIEGHAEAGELSPLLPPPTQISSPADAEPARACCDCRQENRVGSTTLLELAKHGERFPLCLLCKPTAQQELDNTVLAWSHPCFGGSAAAS